MVQGLARDPGKLIRVNSGRLEELFSAAEPGGERRNLMAMGKVPEKQRPK